VQGAANDWEHVCSTSKSSALKILREIQSECAPQISAIWETLSQVRPRPQAIAASQLPQPGTFATDLSQAEREFLTLGVSAFIDAERSTEQLSLAIGFDGLASIDEALARDFAARLDHGTASSLEMTRGLFCTELAFVSSIFGFGNRRATSTGIDDDTSLELVERLQVKLSTAWGPWQSLLRQVG
jgi:hypothetical protein